MMIQSDRGTDPSDKDRTLSTASSPQNGLSGILRLLLQELSVFYSRDVNGVCLLYDLLHSRWLQALLKVLELLTEAPRSSEIQELRQILQNPHYKALLSAHDIVAQKDFEPLLPPLPDNIPENEEAMRIVCLVKNQQPLGATIKRHEITGDILVARVIHGGLVERSKGPSSFSSRSAFLCSLYRSNKSSLHCCAPEPSASPHAASCPSCPQSPGTCMWLTPQHPLENPEELLIAQPLGLLHAGDKLVEVNGISVEGLDPEQVIHLLAMSCETIMFKVVPVSDPPVNNQKMVHIRAMIDYWPQEYPEIPCMDAGLPFQKGDILQIVDQNDALWWQAWKISDLAPCAGLIPSLQLMKRKQREFWWSQPYQPHICLKSTRVNLKNKSVNCCAFPACFLCSHPGISLEEEDDMKIDEKCVEADEEIFESEELAEDKEEFIGTGQRFFIAGFCHSMRLCRRKSNLSQRHTSMCCTGSCSSAVGAPYEEVVRYQRRPTDKYRIVVLVGPSGVGVNELRRQLIEFNPSRFQSAVPRFSFLVDTTRFPKSYEMDGREYHYVSKETFESLMHSHRMLEFGEYKGHLYGTSVDAVHEVLDEEKICVMDLEPQDIQVVRTHELKPYVIFIKPSDMSYMKQSRKNARIITNYFVDMKFKDEDLQEMEDLAQKMETQFGQFFDHVIVNDNLQDACAQLLSVIQKAQEELQWVPAAWISSAAES